MKFNFLVFFCFLIFFICCNSVIAKLNIPASLSKDDRHKATGILGLSSSVKVLGNPFPLGGFSGVEIGFSTEVIPISEISRLGLKSASQSELSYNLLTLGKGLYNNVDIFVQFTPFSQKEDISNFGGQVRWCFYQAEFVPAHISLVGHANSVSYQNKINISSTGYDLVGGFSVDDVTLYAGAGLITSHGQFLGVTDSGLKENDTVSNNHFISGIDIRFRKFFLALEMDRYEEIVYAVKLGSRF